jgi:hypothetical protein
MDDLEKKLLKQCDDEMPAVRQNALEALREHMLKQTPPRHFRDLVADFDNAMPPAKAEELQKKLAEFIKANAAGQKRDADQQREIAKLKADLKAALWIKANWKIIGAVTACLLVVVSGIWSYERYWSRSDAVNAGARATVASATWGEGWGEPVAAKLGGESWWLMFRGDTDASSYADSRGKPIEMRCMHLYASPALPDSGQYIKPSPRFLGIVTWPELATVCKPSPNRQADNAK